MFLPERLELVKGAPGARRAHLDNLVAALWPARAETRTAYSRALGPAQRAAGSRSRRGAAQPTSLGSWDAELARHGWRLMADRAEALELLAPLFAAARRELGLPGAAALRVPPALGRADAGGARGGARRAPAGAISSAASPPTAPTATSSRLVHDGGALRNYGSQGQQRVALLALLFAERDLLGRRARRARR